MRRPIALCCVLLGLGACSNVVSLQPAVPRGSETFEPRLLGDWSVSAGPGSDADHLVVTREGANQYLMRYTNSQHTESSVFVGRFGPLGLRRWVLDFAPVGDTSHYFHPLSGGDSTRTRPPQVPLMIPTHWPIVIERADSGLRFFAIKAESLLTYFSRRPTAAQAGIITEELGATVVLTDSSAAHLNAFMAEFADRPGSLTPLPRVGFTVTISLGH